MEKNRIVYVDEELADVREFQRFADDTFEVIPITPIAEFETLIEQIKESHAEALVVDHNLIEHDKTNSINYLGSDIITRINEEFLGFPAFVLTSYDEEAIDRNEDARIVFEKGLMSATKQQKELYDAGEKFKRLVKAQISKYQVRIQKSEEKLLELLEISKKRDLTEPEEKQLQELDNFIETTLNKKGIVPEELKISSHSEKLQQILSKVDELLESLENDV